MKKSVRRKADSNWEGNAQGGRGLISTGSNALRDAHYSLGSRMDPESENEVNPEELIAAAVAGCFSMALSKTLTDQNHVPTELVTKAEVEMKVGDDGARIETLYLRSEGLVPTVDAQGFEDAVEATRKTCPIYLLLEPGFANIEVEAQLRNVPE